LVRKKLRSFVAGRRPHNMTYIGAIVSTRGLPAKRWSTSPGLKPEEPMLPSQETRIVAFAEPHRVSADKDPDLPIITFQTKSGVSKKSSGPSASTLLNLESSTPPPWCAHKSSVTPPEMGWRGLRIPKAADNKCGESR